MSKGVADESDEKDPDEIADSIRAGVNPDQTAYPSPKPFVSEVSETGGVVVVFSKPLQVIPPEINL